MPPGVIPTRAFPVFLFLYVDHVTRCASGLDGTSIGISVQSMITCVEGYKSMNRCGMVCITLFFPGQIGSPADFLSLEYSSITQVVKILLTAEELMAKRIAKT